MEKGKDKKPVYYSPALGWKIAARLAAGETLKEICKGDAMPSYYTVLDWRRNRPGFRALCELAKDEANYHCFRVVGAVEGKMSEEEMLKNSKWVAEKIRPERKAGKRFAVGVAVPAPRPSAAQSRAEMLDKLRQFCTDNGA